MGKQKFYVVWDGVTPGIYTSWTECQLQVKGYDSAKYKSFDNREEAERAFAASPYAYIGKNAKKKINLLVANNSKKKINIKLILFLKKSL